MLESTTRVQLRTAYKNLLVKVIIVSIVHPNDELLPAAHCPNLDFCILESFIDF